MALIRGNHNFDDHFAQIPNDWLRDSRISLEARGLLAQIMSHKPGWNMSVKSIAAQNGIGRDKVRRIFDELIKHGYLERSETQNHDEKGHLAGYDYVTCDPGGVTQKPSKAEPSKAEPSKVIRPPKNTNLKNTNDKNTNLIETAFDEFWDSYPLKKDKGAARRAFKTATKKTDLETLLDAARAYRDDPNRENPFTKYPASWLNAEAWLNGPLRPRKLSWQEAKELERQQAKQKLDEWLQTQGGSDVES